MKRKLMAGLLLALAATPALAQGTFNPGGRQPTKPAPGLADAYRPVPAPKPPAPPAAPASGGFKPYEPFRGGSTYDPPKPSRTAEPCVTSVYVNSCPNPKR